MPSVTRRGDLDADDVHPSVSHGHAPRSVQNEQWSPSVYANGLNVVRADDLWIDSHNPVNNNESVQSASSTVYANGKALVRTGDVIVNCGRTVGPGSPSVYAN